MKRTRPILSILLLILFAWNLFGWWLLPVSSSIISGSLSGESCCNGAEICCCTSAGLDACHCLPGEIHNDSASNDKTLVCGISSPDNRNHTDESGTLTFLDIRAFISPFFQNPVFYKTNRDLCFSLTSPESTFILEILQPPEFV